MTYRKYYLLVFVCILQSALFIMYAQDGFFKDSELEIIEFPGETIYKLRSNGEVLNGYYKIQRSAGGYYQSQFVNGKPDGKWERFSGNNKLLEEINRKRWCPSWQINNLSSGNRVYPYRAYLCEWRIGRSLCQIKYRRKFP
ncbi:MAG: hypothetical protein LUE98_12840 [Tannerellaceae bacterium]|nr:hypothetical protein [Tannerellaceae bacterium]